MKKLMRSLRNDDGIGLIEVLVALMIFSIIAVGMAYSMISISRLTADSTQRETATNLAAQEIDRIQALPNAFAVTDDDDNPIVVDGVTYNVARYLSWISTTGASGSCGSGGGNLQYKRVNVEVTWPGQYIEEAVRADSILAPTTRINDPSYGVILVSVLGIDGDGRSGVTVRVTPESGGGGVTITDPIANTDADGCTYVLKVSEGKYKIEVEKSGYIDSNQIAVPSYTQQVVAAGSTITASFQYENASSFVLKFAATSNTTTPNLPSNLDTTYVGGLVNYLKTGTVSPLKLHPFASGYQAVAGESDACLNVDPEKWAENSTMAAGLRAPAVATAPGGSADLPIPMGVINFKIPDSNSKDYVTAVQQVTAPASGDPGCATATTYTFPRLPRNTTVPLALPYGSWVFYTGNTLGAKTYSVSSGVTPLDGVVSLDASGVLVKGILGNSKFVASVLTLDPRQVKP